MRHLLTDIPYQTDAIALLKRAGLESGSDEADDFLDLYNRIAPLARPKAFVMSATVDNAPEAPDILLNGVTFSGTILYDNIKDASEVWPFVATCGREAYDFVMAIPDPFERFWGELILEDILAVAVKSLDAYAKENIYAEKTASIAPGSLPEWPIQEQRPLFTLLADGAEQSGVTLTETLLMIPNKSVSGIRFPSEHDYVSCRFCPRDRCPNRKVEYEPDASMMGL